MAKLICKLLDENKEFLFEINNILKIHFTSLDRGSASDTTNWGCFSNSGEIEFLDFNNKYYFAENAKFACIYYFSNKKEKLLATFLIDKYDYNHETKKTRVILIDNLLDFQKKQVGSTFPYVPCSVLSMWQVIPIDFSLSNSVTLRYSSFRTAFSLGKDPFLVTFLKLELILSIAFVVYIIFLTALP